MSKGKRTKRVETRVQRQARDWKREVGVKTRTFLGRRLVRIAEEYSGPVACHWVGRWEDSDRDATWKLMIGITRSGVWSIDLNGRVGGSTSVLVMEIGATLPMAREAFLVRLAKVRRAIAEVTR